MLRYLVIVIVSMGSIIMVSCYATANKWRVEASAFNHLMDSLKDVTLLDVRTQEEWQKGVIRHPVMLDYYRKDFKYKLLELPKDKPVFIYCHTGLRSQQTRKWLIKNGYSEVYDLKSGIVGWKQSGYSIDSIDSFSFFAKSTQ